MAHPHGRSLQGALLVLLPNELVFRVPHVLAEVENIFRHEVSLVIGVVEVRPRVGGIAAGIHLGLPNSQKFSPTCGRFPSKSNPAAGGSRCR